MEVTTNADVVQERGGILTRNAQTKYLQNAPDLKGLMIEKNSNRRSRLSPMRIYSLRFNVALMEIALKLTPSPNFFLRGRLF